MNALAISRRRFTSSILPLLGVAAGLSLTCGSAWAQFSITIHLDEAGNGTFDNTAGFHSALPFAMMPDPGPGGLPSVLFYDMLNPPGLTAGDLTVLSASGKSDVLRFDPTQGLNGAHGGVFVYSDPSGGQPADVGFPTAQEANTALVTEAPDGTVTYTPTTGQPGFVTGAGGPVTYIFVSAPASEPLFFLWFFFS